MIEALLYGAAGLAASWFLVEAASRWWLGRYGRYYSWTPHTRIRLDILEDVLPKLDRVARFQVNALGERGDEAPRPGDNALHMLAVGGSAVECYMNDQVTQWPYRVQMELNRPEALEALGTERVHVGNIGRSLMACDPLCTMLEKVLDNYTQLDVLFFMVGSSDIVAWTEAGAPTNHFVPKPLDWHGIYRLHPRGPFTWLPMRSAFRRLAVAAWRGIQKPEKHNTEVGKSVRRNRERRQEGVMVQELPNPTQMLDRYSEDLGRLIAIAKSKAKRVLVVRTPWIDREIQPDEERWLWNLGLGTPKEGEPKRYLDYPVARKILAEMDRVTVKVANESGVESVDIRSFIEHDFDHFYDEFHLTPKGCESMGKLVSEAILRQAKTNGHTTTQDLSEGPQRRAQA